MAEIARHTWATMQTEVAKRLGRSGVADATTRAGTYLDAAYRWICGFWHHHELEAVAADQALVADADSLALPSDCYIVQGVKIKSDDLSTDYGRLLPKRASWVFSRIARQSARPKEYGRHGSNLYFDATADLNYKLDVFYYKNPTAPDFSTGSPVINRLFDEIIVELAVNMGHPAFWSGEQAMAVDAFLSKYIGIVPNPRMQQGMAPEAFSGGTSDAAPAGGALG